MTFQSQADLAQDPQFRERVVACCLEQALIFKDDARYSFYMLARQYIQSPTSAEQMVALVASSPNFKETTDQASAADIEILGAVQANWATLGGIVYPEPTT